MTDCLSSSKGGTAWEPSQSKSYAANKAMGIIHNDVAEPGRDNEEVGAFESHGAGVDSVS